MKKPISFILFIISLFLILTGYSIKKSDEPIPRYQPEKTAQNEWRSLFDGETFTGWKRYNASDIGTLWKIENGTIVCYGEGGGEATEMGGALITEEQFTNFEFEIEFKISPGGNSGLIYHIIENDSLPHAYNTGPEYQLVDDASWGGDPIRLTASNYDMYPASADKNLNPPGEWNTAKIIYDHGHVEHWLNGEKVLEFEEKSADWQDRYEKSKWPEYPAWCKSETGSIGLQDHGYHIWFKNIRVKVFDK